VTMKRRTRQGEILLRVIRSADRPLTPSEIKQLAAKEMPKLGIATTYRYIRELADMGKIAGVDYPGHPPRYEWADGKDKVHFSCRCCLKLYALADTTKETPLNEIPEGFNVSGYELMLYGTCPSCGPQNE